MKPVLVPVDYSDESRAVLEYALVLAQGLGVDLHVLYVAETMPDFSPELLVKTEQGVRPLCDIVEENAAREMKEFLARTAPPENTKLVEHIVRGHAGSTIVSWTRNGRFELVVIGTHGRRGLSRLALGSVAGKVVRLSPIPVVTLPSRHAHSESS